LTKATEVDARGMRCPWPVIRLGRAMREKGGPVLIRADDPIAGREIATLALARGWTVQIAGEQAWMVAAAADELQRGQSPT